MRAANTAESRIHEVLGNGRATCKFHLDQSNRCRYTSSAISESTMSSFTPSSNEEHVASLRKKLQNTGYKFPVDEFGDHVRRWRHDEKSDLCHHGWRQKCAAAKTSIKFLSHCSRQSKRLVLQHWYQQTMLLKRSEKFKRKSSKVLKNHVEDPRSPARAVPSAIKHGAIESDTKGNLKRASMETSLKRNRMVNAVLTKEAYRIFYQQTLSRLRVDDEGEKPPSLEERISDFVQTKRDLKQTYTRKTKFGEEELVRPPTTKATYVHYHRGDKVSVLQPLRKSHTLNHLSRAIAEWITAKTKDLPWFTILPFKEDDPRAINFCEKWLKSFSKNRKKMITRGFESHWFEFNFKPLRGDKTLRQHVYNSKNDAYNWILATLPGRLDFTPAGGAQEKRKWIKIMNFAVIICRLSSRQSKGFVDEFAGEEFKRKTVKSKEKEAFGLLLHIVTAQLAIMYLNGAGMESSGTVSSGHDTSIVSVEANTIAHKLGSDIAAHIEHGSLDDSLCTGIISKISKMTREPVGCPGFSEDKLYIFESARDWRAGLRRQSLLADHKNDENVYSVTYTESWGEGGEDPRPSRVPYEMLSPMNAEIESEDVEIYIDVAKVALTNSVDAMLLAQEFCGKICDKVCDEETEHAWWTQRLKECEGIDEELDKMYELQTNALEKITAQRDEKTRSMNHGKKEEELQQLEEERQNRIKNHGELMQQSLMEEKELLIELNFWTQQANIEASKLRVMESGEINPSHTMESPGQDVEEYICNSRSKDDALHPGDIASNDLSISIFS